MKSMILVDKKTGKPLVEGQTVTTFRGVECVLKGWREPQHGGSTGRVWIKGGREYFPSVIGAVFVPADSMEGEE